MNNQSSSMINKLSVSQNLEMASQHSTTAEFSSRYKFNAKELDQETGWYYYGARYYDPSVSQWMSVDPLLEKYPAFNPYNYTLNNPIMLVDPDGMAPDCCGIDELKATYSYVKNNISKAINYVQNHGVAEVSVTPSVGFQISQKNKLGGIDLGVAVTEGNTYKASIFENSNEKNFSISETDLKMHTFAKISVGTEEKVNGVRMGGSVKVDYVHNDISFEGGKVEYEVALGPKVSGKTLGGDKYSSFNVKPSLKGYTKINQKGKTFVGVDFGMKASLILGVKVDLKVGFNL